MGYFKTVNAGYIESISTYFGTEEITESEYDELMSIAKSAPKAEGKGYRLKTDLTWEEYNLPEIDDGNEEVTAEEIAQAIAEVFNDEE